MVPSKPAQMKSEGLLNGKSFAWASYDHPGVVTAMVQTVLRDWFLNQAVQLRLVLTDAPDELAIAAGEESLALSLWTLSNSEELGDICDSIDRVRNSRSDTLRICYLRPDFRIYAPIVLEAGAQIAVSELPSLQNALLRLLDHVELSDDGYHPLTSGLLQRLPWPEPDD